MDQLDDLIDAFQPALADGRVDHLPLGLVNAGSREYQRQRGFALGEVVTDVLAEGIGVRGVI